MQSEKLSSCPGSPLLPAQVSECIVRRFENVHSVVLDTRISDVELGERCPQVVGQEVANVKSVAKEDGEDGSKLKKEEENKGDGDGSRAGPDGGWSWAVLLGSFVVMVSRPSLCSTPPASPPVSQSSLVCSFLVTMFTIHVLVYQMYSYSYLGCTDCELGHGKLTCSVAYQLDIHNYNVVRELLHHTDL